MTQIKKKLILKNLYTLKSFDYKYLEQPNFHHMVNVKNINLPNNLDDLNKMVNNCFLCDLSKIRKNILFGEGNTKANIMFIGHCPSELQDELGVFYAGKSGEILINMVQNVLNISKEEVYLTNLLKCKTLNKVNSMQFDVCIDYLNKQIEIIKPKLIVLMGEKAYTLLMKNKDDFLKNKGKILHYNGISMMPIYSPRFLMRNPSCKKEAYFDMLKIKAFLGK